MGDYLGATICLTEIAQYMLLACDTGRVAQLLNGSFTAWLPLMILSTMLTVFTVCNRLSYAAYNKTD